MPYQDSTNFDHGTKKYTLLPWHNIVQAGGGLVTGLVKPPCYLQWYRFPLATLFVVFSTNPLSITVLSLSNTECWKGWTWIKVKAFVVFSTWTKTSNYSLMLLRVGNTHGRKSWNTQHSRKTTQQRQVIYSHTSLDIPEQTWVTSGKLQVFLVWLLYTKSPTFHKFHKVAFSKPELLDCCYFVLALSSAALVVSSCFFWVTMCCLLSWSCNCRSELSLWSRRWLGVTYS